jgi:hypothetical protein
MKPVSLPTYNFELVRKGKEDLISKLHNDIASIFLDLRF